MEISVDVTIQITSELQRRMKTDVSPKRSRRIRASDLSRQLSAATVTTVSKQTVNTHIGVYARRILRCVPYG
ncbi:hypothetical protein TNCV_1881541 [Trichonephila clavipes]|nr:hypothetical protein TNCV_1881541 [Trichonephila clavipes]